MIAMFTDFGVTGPYLGQMQAVLHQQAPGLPVVSVFPDLPAFKIRAAAYLLPACSACLPATAVCLCVVDPGVGSARRALALRADGRWYVGPDNGLFTLVMRRATQLEVFEIQWRPEQLSDSFHGRDLFAPVAAGLARGEPVPGAPLARDTLLRPDWPDDLAELVYIDAYGNAMTGLRAAAMPVDAVLQVAGQSCGYARVFAEAVDGKPFWYANSSGLVEIALPGASAAATLGLRVGMPVGTPRL